MPSYQAVVLCRYTHMYVCVCLSVQKVYQELVRSEGMIEHLVRGLKKENRELQRHCAAAIFKVCNR